MAQRVQNMTEGSPMKRMLSFGLPLLFGTLFQQFYSLVDTMVVGYTLGDRAISAIGATSSVYSLLFFLTASLNSGFAIPIGQLFGAGDLPRLRKAVAGALLLNLLFGVVLTALSLGLLGPVISLLNTPDDIRADAAIYIGIICAGLLSTVCYNMFSRLLNSLGDSRTPLMFLILTSLLNIALDFLLVAGFSLGVAGAALATVISQVVSCLLCGVFLVRNFRAYLPGREDFRVPGKLMLELISTGSAMALMSVVVDIGSVIFQSAANTLGIAIITAHTASRRLIELLLQPLGSLSAAFSVFTAQNYGAGKRSRICTALAQVLLLSALWSLIATCFVYLLGGSIIRLTTGTTDPVVLRNAVLSLRVHLPFYPMLGAVFCLRSGLQAMGFKIVPICSSVVELAIKLLSAWMLISRLGYLGVCITEPASWTLMTLFLGGAYLLKYRATLAKEEML